MANHRNEFEESIRENKKIDVDTYLSKMAKNGTLGGNIEIHAFQAWRESIDRPVQVIILDSRKYPNVSLIPEGRKYMGPRMLLKRHRNHFEALNHIRAVGYELPLPSELRAQRERREDN